MQLTKMLTAKRFIIIMNGILFKGKTIYELSNKTMGNVHDGIK